MPPPWRTGKVTRITDETTNTKRFWIEVPDITSFDFQPGQFVTLDLPIHEKPAKRLRSYSIASPPDKTNVMELVISYMEHGAGTNYLFNNVREGSELTFRGPLGVFVLPGDLDRDIYMICTGTGIAPFRSMAHYVFKQNIPHRNLYLIFGCRTKADILYFDEMRELQASFAGFEYIPTLSREQWDGRTGYVHPIYEEISMTSKRIIAGDNGESAPEPAYFFLCGWKNMIDEAKKRIVALGYDKKSIHQELYG